ncbi:cation:proton antiporter [Dactylosporangium sp. NPDC051485]|uniref:cation:proton antiporter n=1 Tax=Dactylosporangium sp. NPDC051485 TaxID=3154846 RepID=UPI00343F8287
MSFGSLAVVSAVALLGPLLALPQRWHLPVVLGQLVAGAAVGRTGAGIIDARDGTFTFLANIGFALVMFVAGTHVPVRDLRLHGALRIGFARVAGVAALACIPAVLLGNVFFHTGHAALYAVLMASSSAALILPIVDGLGLSGGAVLQLLPQVALADAVCIVALPLAIDPRHAGRAALGAGLVLAATAVLYVLLRWLEASGLRKRVHRVSERRKFAIEMRVNLVILFALAALAQAAHVSVLLAGFCFGLAVAAVGEPRRLARQLFALTEGFLGPLFFVWLGATLDVRALAEDLRSAVLAVALGLGAVLVHVAMRLTGQPIAYGGLAAAQLGVPVAAATLGTQLGLLRPAEAAALILAAILTIAVAVWSAAAASRAAAPTP